MEPIEVETQDLKVIILHETLWESILSDIITFGGMILLIGVGIYFESIVMEAVGAIMMGVFLFSRLFLITRKSLTATPEQAIEYLELKFRVKRLPPLK